MSPAGKFNSLVASVTVSLMFVLVAYAAPLLTRQGTDNPLFLSMAGLVTSAGVYRVLAISIRWLMDRLEVVKRLVLGPEYVHGTWIGWFRGHGDDLRYMVEHFTQDLNGLVISGRSYSDAREVHGWWHSDSVSIDARAGRLVFTYQFNVATQSSPLIGIHTSQFERESFRHAPKAYSGFAHDLNDNVRIPVQATKISSALLPWNEALAQAERLFKDD